MQLLTLLICSLLHLSISHLFYILKALDCTPCLTHRLFLQLSWLDGLSVVLQPCRVSLQVSAQAGIAHPVILSLNTDRKVWIISAITNYLSLIMFQALCCLAPGQSELSQVFIIVLVTFPSLHQPCKETPFFIPLIVMTTRLCAAACHFIALKLRKQHCCTSAL